MGEILQRVLRLEVFFRQFHRHVFQLRRLRVVRIQLVCGSLQKLFRFQVFLALLAARDFALQRVKPFVDLLILQNFL